MGINFFEQDEPDATTMLHFRHLLEEHGIGKLFFDAINRCLERAGRMMRGGTIVDATLISAPSSTKNVEKKRDPEMHQTKKGNQWHFGMKCHTGVDAGSGSIRWKPPPPMFMLPWRQSCCGRMTRLSMATAPIWGLKNGKKSKMIRSFPQSNCALIANRAGCPGFQTIPLTGSGILKIANPLCAARWSIPTES